MKKYACVILAMLFFVGMGTASTVTAALVYDGLSIDVDFWTSASDRLVRETKAARSIWG